MARLVQTVFFYLIASFCKVLALFEADGRPAGVESFQPNMEIGRDGSNQNPTSEIQFNVHIREPAQIFRITIPFNPNNPSGPCNIL